MKAALKYAWEARYGMPKKALPDAGVAFREIERIRKVNGGKMRPEYLVEAAKDNSNPLHRTFNWNVKSAAMEHWLHQARMIMGSIRVVRETGKHHHAYYAVKSEKVHFYTPAAEVASNEEYRTQLLKQAEQYYTAGRARFDEITELEPLHRAIDEAFSGKVKGRKSKAA